MSRDDMSRQMQIEYDVYVCVCLVSYTIYRLLLQELLRSCSTTHRTHRYKRIGVSACGRERVYVRLCASERERVWVRVSEREWERERERPRARHCSSVVFCTQYALHTQCTVRVPCVHDNQSRTLYVCIIVVVIL
jgi:hypothetical protein